MAGISPQTIIGFGPGPPFPIVRSSPQRLVPSSPEIFYPGPQPWLILPGIVNIPTPVQFRTPPLPPPSSWRRTIYIFQHPPPPQAALLPPVMFRFPPVRQPTITYQAATPPVARPRPFILPQQPAPVRNKLSSFTGHVMIENLYILLLLLLYSSVLQHHRHPFHQLLLPLLDTKGNKTMRKMVKLSTEQSHF